MHRNRIELQNAYERIMNSRSALDEFGEIVIETRSRSRQFQRGSILH